MKVTDLLLHQICAGLSQRGGSLHETSVSRSSSCMARGGPPLKGSRGATLLQLASPPSSAELPRELSATEGGNL